MGLWQTHLAALARASGHPELIHAPWAPIGLSNGGTMSYGFNALRPHKVIAFVANKGCCYNAPFPSEAALDTPGLLIGGEFDAQFRRDDIRALFDNNRPRGALWAWAEEERTGHVNSVDELFLPFMAEAIRLRYPAGELPSATAGVALQPLVEENGWLADQTSWRSGLAKVAAYADYAGDKSAAGWLLNENLAQLYRAFATYNKPVSIQFPASRLQLGESMGSQLPLPVNVRINTAAVPNWSKVELFDLGQKVGEILAAGSSATTAIIPTALSPARVHSLTALVTHADGVTVSTTHMATILTAVPEPNSAVLWLAVAVIGASRLKCPSPPIAEINDSDSSLESPQARMRIPLRGKGLGSV
jgi:hypothetical protein